jgi:hypothetical protein
MDGYSKLFPECQAGQVCLEATPDNMYQQSALKVLSELATEPLIVFIVRNPVERALSMYEFAKNKLGSLSATVSARAFFEGARDGLLIEDQISNNALLYGEYHLWLEAWINACGKSRVEVFFFEDIVEAPLSIVKKICNRIGVDDQFYNDFDFRPENQGREIRSEMLLQLVLKIKKISGRMWPILVNSSFLKFIYSTINVKSSSRKQEDDSVLLEEMYEYFSAPNHKLALLLGRELPAGW